MDRVRPRRRGLVPALLFVAVLGGLATAGVSSGAGLFDGGGFPTATPTATLEPTAEPTLTPTNIPLQSVFPVETPTLVLPNPMEQSLKADAIESQAAAGGSSSPSLVLIALPFLGAFLLLALIVGNWLRRARG